MIMKKISIQIPDGTSCATFSYVFLDADGHKIGCTVFTSKDLFDGACLSVPDKDIYDEEK